MVFYVKHAEKSRQYNLKKSERTTCWVIICFYFEILHLLRLIWSMDIYLIYVLTFLDYLGQLMKKNSCLEISLTFPLHR